MIEKLWNFASPFVKFAEFAVCSVWVHCVLL